MDHPTELDQRAERVRETYAATARRVRSGAQATCCAPSCCSGETAEGAERDPITSDLYSMGEAASVPDGAVAASLGCGNPTALARLVEGETVLDLGSGGGIDVLLSAQRVGATGKVYGVDMTDEMLELARDHAARAGVTNVEFLKGQIESIPLPENAVDVIISNCVINLSGDKRAVLREAFRVLKPGGRFAVSDVIVRGELPPSVRASLALWSGCIAGALDEGEFIDILNETGFEAASVEVTREYSLDDAAAILASDERTVGIDPATISGRLASAFVRARKPVAAP